MISAIWWIRRDLRLADNQAFAAALNYGETVSPVFILDPHLLESRYASVQRIAFLFDGLRALDADLRQRGGSLVIRQGHPPHVLRGLLGETGAGRIFAEEDASPYARRRDALVAQALPLELTPGLTVFPADMLRKANGTPYTVFTPFKSMWRSLPFPGSPMPAPQHLPTPPALDSLPIPNRPARSAEIPFTAGETEAQRRLNDFLTGAIQSYHDDRNRMDRDGTSCLSPYLRFGMLSARQAAWAARRALENAESLTAHQGAEAWLNEIIWREFYVAILYHFPYVRKMAFKPAFQNIAWRDDTAELEAWKEGRTGCPVVDAAMRQMNSNGWMHNRARMIAASFLTKDLLIDWRKGEQYFMQRLLDGDPAANNGGWQWTAGTGTDASPYFRVFNPDLQGKKFDPRGAYMRRWVPELKSVPDAYIHAPWKMPAAVQEQTGCRIGETYPAPIVDHAAARQRALNAYRR